MNIEDIQLMRNIISQLGDMNHGNKVLFSVSYERIAKTNLILLRALLEELSKKGILVTVDRPHQYMEHLLRMHRIDYNNLLFIDTIARFSGNILSDNLDIGNVRIVASPFQIDLLPGLFALNPEDVGGIEGKIDVTGMDFILIDNVATMLNYNDPSTVESFLENYLAKFRNLNNILISLTLDRVTHISLYQAARKLFDREINVDKLRSGKVGIDRESRERSLFSDKKTMLDLYSYRKCFNEGD
ncbi:MAG: hypothetical protein V3U20_01050 [Thermoplasmata archaeon]